MSPRALAAPLLFALAACHARAPSEAADAESQALAEDGIDANATESDAETTVTSFLSATAARLATPSFYQPAGCLAVTSDAAAQTATYRFDRCTGPRGLVTISGAIDLAWSVDASNALNLTVTASDVHLNRALVSAWNASARVVASGAARTMTWTASIAGTTARGRPFDRAATQTLAWSVGEPCVTVDGASDGQVAARRLHADVAGLQRCGGCPRAGTITVTNVDSGKSIALAFDGSDAARFTAVNGAATEVPLDCQ